MFAKVYEYENRSEILVKKDVNKDECPEVRVFFQPEELGVCNFAFTYHDTDTGYESQEKCFDELTKEKAFSLVEEMEAKLQ
jgi:hypothetical protein